jgi:hypothetical protein
MRDYTFNDHLHRKKIINLTQFIKLRIHPTFETLNFAIKEYSPCSRAKRRWASFCGLSWKTTEACRHANGVRSDKAAYRATLPSQHGIGRSACS